MFLWFILFFFFASRRRHTIFACDWSSDVCSSDLWNWRQQKSAPEKLDVPRTVPLGAPSAETVWMLTLTLAKVVSAASETRSSPPVAPAVKVWASTLTELCWLMISTCDWSRASVVAPAGADADKKRTAANTAATEPRPTSLRNEFFT